MRLNHRIIALMLSAAALAASSAITGCAGDELVYDPTGMTITAGAMARTAVTGSGKWEAIVLTWTFPTELPAINWPTGIGAIG